MTLVVGGNLCLPQWRSVKVSVEPYPDEKLALGEVSRSYRAGLIVVFTKIKAPNAVEVVVLLIMSIYLN